MGPKEATSCAACTLAAARIGAALARVLYRHASYWFDPESDQIKTFAPVIKAARHAERRADAIVRSRVAVPHTCDGNPTRCTTCSAPLVTSDATCINPHCGAPLDESDIRMFGAPLRPMDKVAPTDVAIMRADITYSHHGGESRWPCVVYVTLDGDVYHASEMHPTNLPE
ncbi:MAG: hypothetical protein V1723_00815, partial [Candidatus Uhrbacteria bacterium]